VAAAGSADPAAALVGPAAALEARASVLDSAGPDGAPVGEGPAGAARSVRGGVRPASGWAAGTVSRSSQNCTPALFQAGLFTPAFGLTHDLWPPDDSIEGAAGYYGYAGDEEFYDERMGNRRADEAAPPMPTRLTFKVERAKDIGGTATSPVPLLGAALNADVYPVISLHHNGTEIARVQGATCRSGGTDPVWRGTKDITIILGESLDSKLHELQFRCTLYAKGVFADEEMCYTELSKAENVWGGQAYQHPLVNKKSEQKQGTVTMSVALLVRDTSSSSSGSSSSSSPAVAVGVPVSGGGGVHPAMAEAIKTEAAPTPSAPPAKSDANPF